MIPAGLAVGDAAPGFEFARSFFEPDLVLDD